MSRIVAAGLAKSFGALPVIDPLDLDITPGSFVSIIGPSGCGKTTLVRILAGLETASAGTVTVDGAAPAAARAGKRVAMVPQQPGLLPWRSVAQNARLLLDVNRTANPADAEDPEALLHEVGLGAFLHSLPHELSGGMQQRVALVRALTLHAPLVVMDEPFAALDEITRSEMRMLLLRMVEQRATTVLFVTHSIHEAVLLADRVLVTGPRPARLVADIAVDLPRPRPTDSEDSPRFAALCSQVRHALHDGVNG